MSAETSWWSRKAVTPERGIKLDSSLWVSFLGTIAQNKPKRKEKRERGGGGWGIRPKRYPFLGLVNGTGVILNSYVSVLGSWSLSLVNSISCFIEFLSNSTATPFDLGYMLNKL